MVKLIGCCCGCFKRCFKGSLRCCIKCPGRCLRLPGMERFHPCLYIPCSKRYREMQKRKIDTSKKPSRWPTDPLCLLAFSMFWVGMAIIAVFALWSGNPKTLILPTDYQDNICGYAKGEGNNNLYDLSNKKFLWYPFSFDSSDISSSLFLDALDLGICVEECPDITDALRLNLTDVFKSFDDFVSQLTQNMLICNYDKSDASFIEKTYYAGNKSGCYINVFPTSPLTKRCIPTFTQLNFTVSSTYQNFVDTFMKVGNVIKAGFWEVRIAWFPLVITAIVVLAACFAIVICVRFILTPMLYFTLGSLWLLLMVASGYCGWIAYRRYQDSKVSDEVTDSTQRNISYVFMGFAGFFFLLLILYSCLVLFLMRRIARAVSIIKVASRPMYRVISMLIVPPLTFLGLVAITAYWLMIAGYIQSATTPVSLDSSALSSLPVSSLPINITQSYTVRKGDTTIQAFQWYHLFGYFWSAAFIQAIGYTTIAGVITQWYFSSQLDPDRDFKRENKRRGYYKRSQLFTVPRVFLTVLIYHSGSLLFGSLLVAIVQTIRALYRKMEKTIKLASLASGGAAIPIRILLCCGRCCLAGVYLLVKFFNKNAYIMMMIHGGYFLSSGSRAFGLIANNITLVGTVNFIGHLMLHISQIVIALFGGLLSYLLIDLFERYEVRLVMGEVVYYVVPVITGLIISYLIAGMFMNTYITAIDTVLLCYLEDKRQDKDCPYTPAPLRNKHFWDYFIPSIFSMAKNRVKNRGKRADDSDLDKKKSKKARNKGRKSRKKRKRGKKKKRRR